MAQWLVGELVGENIIEADGFDICPLGNLIFYTGGNKVASFSTWLSVVSWDDLEDDGLECLGRSCVDCLDSDGDGYDFLPVVTIVSGDDWKGLYFDGNLVTQGHEISLRDFAEHVNEIGVFELDTVDVDSDWLKARGNLPDDLGDIVVGV